MGVPLGLISILALVLAIIYVICMKRKRNQRVDAAEGAPGSDEIGTNRYWRDVVKHNDPTPYSDTDQIYTNDEQQL